ncbi:MAG: glycoside hydrolase family 16 protein [Gillisia sp.]|nr:glycoside hydrolase family 16 protein [Gillisia sp.]
MKNNRLTISAFKSSKNLFKIVGFFILAILLFLSCVGSSNNEVPNPTPSNLVFAVEILGTTTPNPNGDGSGKVILNFSAENATSYKINLGNGKVLETSAKTIPYTYIGKGTNTYEIFVSAYNADKFISASKTITIYGAPDLVWADEFNKDGSPDNTKWGYDLGAGGWGNNESQHYTDRAENVIVEGGSLKITAKKEAYQGSQYTSARMLTKGKFDFKYGKVEVRAKLPKGGGTWPAIWLLGSNISTVDWPNCGEVDIMEHAGNRQGIVSSAMHTPSSYGNTINKGSQTLTNVSTDFHVYAVEWTSEKMIFSVDDKVHYTYNPATKNSSTWPFDAKQFLILNVAMGGTFGGAIDPAFTQSSMEIDYVRVYQQ